MILDFEYRNKQILISEINEDGDIKLNYYPWSSPQKFVPCDDSDPDKHVKYTTWDKKPVKLQYTSRPNRFAIYEFLDRLDEKEKERLFSYQTPKTFFVDIETEILDTGFVEPEDPISKVQTICVVKDRKVWVLGIKKLSKQSCNNIKNKIETHFEDFDVKVDFAAKATQIEQKVPRRVKIALGFYQG